MPTILALGWLVFTTFGPPPEKAPAATVFLAPCSGFDSTCDRAGGVDRLGSLAPPARPPCRAAGMPPSPRSPQSDRDGQAAAAVPERIVTPEEVEAATRPGAAAPLRLLGWPYRQLLAAMNAGLVAVERHNVPEHITDVQERLQDRGIRLLFGGLGEGSGFGAGMVWETPPRQQEGLQLMARFSFAGYQELAAHYQMSLPLSRLALQTDYQWRPNEPFYGFGQDSREADAASFALRQFSAGATWEVEPFDFLRLGSEYKVGLLKGLDSDGGGRPPVSAVFGADLQGLGDRVDLHSVGFFFDVDFFGTGHRLGGRAHGGVSWQDGLGDSELRYTRYELRLEGRLPIVEGRSALLGQASTEMTRESAGSSPLPFYLFPRIGGSATLRGFALDRFYGRNMIFLSIEYRYDIHPNFQVSLFHDAGQIYDHSRELGFFDWHRNYGIGFRYRTLTGTKLLIELGPGDEGFAFHISFGDRAPRPLGGPIRYPLYRQ